MKGSGVCNIIYILTFNCGTEVDLERELLLVLKSFERSELCEMEYCVDDLNYTYVNWFEAEPVSFFQ